VIARLDEDSVSRDHALVESLGSDRVKLTNTSAKSSIRHRRSSNPGKQAVFHVRSSLLPAKRC